MDNAGSHEFQIDRHGENPDGTYDLFANMARQAGITEEQRLNEPYLEEYVFIVTLARLLHGRLQKAESSYEKLIDKAPEEIREVMLRAYRSTELTMRSVAMILEDVFDKSGDDHRGYIKYKGLLGLQALGLCREVNMSLTEDEERRP